MDGDTGEVARYKQFVELDGSCNRLYKDDDLRKRDALVMTILVGCALHT